MPEEDKRLVEFERLNLFGKAVFITGTTFRFVGDLLGTVVETVTGIIDETEKAFVQGADPNIDEATILDEDEANSDRKTQEK